jgi:hypothetical protein
MYTTEIEEYLNRVIFRFNDYMGGIDSILNLLEYDEPREWSKASEDFTIWARIDPALHQCDYTSGCSRL